MLRFVKILQNRRLIGLAFGLGLALTACGAQQNAAPNHSSTSSTTSTTVAPTTTTVASPQAASDTADSVDSDLNDLNADLSAVDSAPTDEGDVQ